MDNAYASTLDPTIAADYPLLEGEKILSITPRPLREFPSSPSSMKQLLRLTRSAHINEIGASGPAIASLAMTTDDEVPGEDSEYLHLYETVFGRDSLRTANDLIDTYPDLARATLLALARLQGVEDHAAREEEPGRIVHEVRSLDDPIAQRLTLERGWQWPYYGTADATSEFIRTLADYTLASPSNHRFLTEQYINRSGKERTINDALDEALNWIARRRAANPEGLVEYKSTIPHGIENQVWKDSWDAYHHSDGTIANRTHGIASIEVQVSAYEALIGAAELYDQLIDNDTRSAALRVQASELRDAIFKYFWTEDKGGYFVIGTDRTDDGVIRQLKIRTSNMGHTLNSRLLEGDDPEIVRMRTAVARQILSPELWCHAGIRTLASDELRFRPGAYHNGSVWPWDTHYISKGLRRHGYTEAADTIDQHIIEISETTGLFPEYVKGNQDGITLNKDTVLLWDEGAQRENAIEQPPQQVQAWTVTAVRDSKRLAWQHTTPLGHSS